MKVWGGSLVTIKFGILKNVLKGYLLDGQQMKTLSLLNVTGGCECRREFTKTVSLIDNNNMSSDNCSNLPILYCIFDRFRY